MSSLAPDDARPATGGRIHIRTSQIMAGFARPEADSAETVRFGDLIERLDQRAFGILLVLLALPCAIPGPPAVTSFLGIPLLLVALQMIGQRSVPWLPRRLRDYEMRQTVVNHFIARALPWVGRLEAVSKPRFELLTSGHAERLLGVLIAVLALCIMIPLPLSNLPPGIAIVIMGFALIERDGVLLAIGLIASAIALFIMIGVVKLAALIVSKFFAAIVG
jgi:hypothetical protein